MDGFRFDLMGHLMKHTMVISLIYGHSNSMLVSNTHQNSAFKFYWMVGDLPLLILLLSKINATMDVCLDIAASKGSA